MGNARSVTLGSVLLAIVLVTTGCGADEGAARSSDRTADTLASPRPGASADTAEPDGPTSGLDTGSDEDDRESPPDGVAVDRSTEDGSGEPLATITDDGDAIDDAPQAGRAGPILAQVGPDDSGDDVAALQARLAELGFDPGPADGVFGRRTRVALHTFQEVAQLPPTGRADRRTVEALADYHYDGLALVAGDEGDDVEELQRRLAAGPFDPGPVDGVYGSATVAAVWALEKLADVPVDGNWGPVDELAWQRLLEGRIGQPERQHDQRWVEVDLSQQLMKVYDPGSSTPVLISHASSGSGIPWENEDHRGSSVTPLGDFHINRRISGWRESSLDIGRLYNPLYFNGGIAFHGATSVPLHPASHGCIRLPMHVADYLPGELPNGTPVHVLA